MVRLHSELFAICSRNRDGSFATQSNRRSILSQFADDLSLLVSTSKKMGAQDLKGRHVGALLVAGSPKDWRFYD